MKIKKFVIMGVIALSLFGVNAYAANTADTYMQFRGGDRDRYSYSAARPKMDSSSVYVKQNGTVAYLMGGGEVGLMKGDAVSVSVVTEGAQAFWTQSAVFGKGTNGKVVRIQTMAHEINGTGRTVKLKGESLQYQPNYTYYITGVWSPDSR